MTDDNTIDNSNRLRQRLPSCHVGKIDTLKDSYEAVYNLIAISASVRRDLPDDDVSGPWNAEEVERAAKSIDDAIVL